MGFWTKFVAVLFGTAVATEAAEAQTPAPAADMGTHGTEVRAVNKKAIKGLVSTGLMPTDIDINNFPVAEVVQGITVVRSAEERTKVIKTGNTGNIVQYYIPGRDGEYVDARINIAKPFVVPKAAEVDANIEFAFGKSGIRPEATKTINKMADYLIAHPGARLEISGYTDTHSGDEFNDKLSLDRANSAYETVLKALKKKLTPEKMAELGINSPADLLVNVTKKHFGEQTDHLKVQTGDEVKNQQNRRGEFHITWDEATLKTNVKQHYLITPESPEELHFSNVLSPKALKILQDMHGKESVKLARGEGSITLSTDLEKPVKIKMIGKTTDRFEFNVADNGQPVRFDKVGDHVEVMSIGTDGAPRILAEIYLGKGDKAENMQVNIIGEQGAKPLKLGVMEGLLSGPQDMTAAQAAHLYNLHNPQSVAATKVRDKQVQVHTLNAAKAQEIAAGMQATHDAAIKDGKSETQANQAVMERVGMAIEIAPPTTPKGNKPGPAGAHK